MRRVSIALAALATVVITAHADVYKSIDAQGQARYSDQWSPGAVLIKSESGRQPTPASDAPAPPADRAQNPEPGKADAARQVQADLAVARAQQCQQLKEQYAKVIQARRIYQAGTGSDSSAPKQYLTDAEADAERVRTRQAMEEACAGGAGG